MLAGGASLNLAIAQDPPPSDTIWFDELIDAEPLTAAAREDLGGYLVALALRRGALAVELPPSLAGDRQPRMVFATLGDGANPARVLRVAGHGAAGVAESLAVELGDLAAELTLRALRIDLVTEVVRRALDPEQTLPLPRSLHGLAFGRQLGLAYLADQVVTHTLINSDQELRLRNVRKRPQTAAVLPLLERLGAAERVPLFRFATAAWFSDGGETVPLYRGHRTFIDLDPEMLLRHAELGGRYLTRAVDGAGRFVYSYLPKTDAVKSSYNALRHCGTIFSMLELYEVSGDRELLAAAERALAYLESRLLGRCRIGDVETACVVERGEVKLGGNALAIVALAKYTAATGDRRYSRLIDDLGRWILTTQGEDGEFEIHKQSHPGGEVSDFVSGYYPGEALLALVRRPEPDPAWIDAAERGARWLIEVRDRQVPDNALNHDHWLLYALDELYRLRPNPLYLQHATRITGAILGRQRQRRPEFPDWLGSYYRPPRSTPTATRSEGLGAAYLMVRDAGRIGPGHHRPGREQQQAALLEALELGVRFQLQTQLLPENVLYLADPGRALGGFHRSLTDYEIRIDYVQHNISALLLLRRILLDRKPAPASR
ncbi:MAG: hypothetical protein V3T72_06225 [Thermoanaerobaculia bacterium]